MNEIGLEAVHALASSNLEPQARRRIISILHPIHDELDERDQAVNAVVFSPVYNPDFSNVRERNLVSFTKAALLVLPAHVH